MIFVYGTLKRGCPNNQLLAGQDFLGETRTPPAYRLYDSGSYPCLVEDRQRGVAVRGEVWHLDDVTLSRVDEMEDVPHLFIRREIRVDEPFRQVFAYFYQGDTSGMRDCGDCWPSVH
jgi:gamma-glutamylcyclotransferase (GGCT)/AIG2-like uncharacterized protein YtfP